MSGESIFHNFDDLLSAWAEAKDQFIIDKAPSLCRKDIPDGAINVGQTYSSIAFYEGKGLLKLWRSAYTNPFACNFSQVLKDTKITELKDIAEKFFADGGILVVFLTPRHRSNIDFVCKLLGELFLNMVTSSCISRIPFPLKRLDAKRDGNKYLGVTYPEKTILWGCYWPFDIMPVDTECVELKETLEDQRTSQAERVKITDFMDLTKHEFPKYSESAPYLSLDEVSHNDNVLPVIVAAKVYAGAIIAVPEVAKNQLLDKIKSIKLEQGLKGFDAVLELRRQITQNNPETMVNTPAEGIEKIESADPSIKPEEKPASIPQLNITITELTEQQKAELYKIPTTEPVFDIGGVKDKDKRSASALGLLKFLAIYAASVKPDAHFIFEDKINVAIRMGTNSLTNAYDLKCFYKGKKNDNPVSSSVRTEVNKLIEIFLPKKPEACNYIAEKFTSYDKKGNREVRFKNITLKIKNPETETTIIAELCKRSNDENLKTFLLSAVGIKYPQDSQSNPTPLISVTAAS